MEDRSGQFVPGDGLFEGAIDLVKTLLVEGVRGVCKRTDASRPGAQSGFFNSPWRVSMKSDSDLQHDIEEELANEADVNVTQLDVQVYKGAVTITGNVATEREKWKADDALRRNADVASLVNDRPPGGEVVLRARDSTQLGKHPGSGHDAPIRRTSRAPLRGTNPESRRGQ